MPGDKCFKRKAAPDGERVHAAPGRAGGKGYALEVEQRKPITSQAVADEVAAQVAAQSQRSRRRWLRRLRGGRQCSNLSRHDQSDGWRHHPLLSRGLGGAAPAQVDVRALLLESRRRKNGYAQPADGFISSILAVARAAVPWGSRWSRAPDVRGFCMCGSQSAFSRCGKQSMHSCLLLLRRSLMSFSGFVVVFLGTGPRVERAAARMPRRRWCRRGLRRRPRLCRKRNGSSQCSW